METISTVSLMRTKEQCMTFVFNMEENSQKLHGAISNKSTMAFQTITDKCPELDNFMVFCFSITNKFVRLKSAKKVDKIISRT